MSNIKYSDEEIINQLKNVLNQTEIIIYHKSKRKTIKKKIKKMIQKIEEEGVESVLDYDEK